MLNDKQGTRYMADTLLPYPNAPEMTGLACSQVRDCRTAKRRGHEGRIKRRKRAIDRLVPAVGEVGHYENRTRVPAADIGCSVLDAPGGHLGAVCRMQIEVGEVDGLADLFRIAECVRIGESRGGERHGREQAKYQGSTGKGPCHSSFGFSAREKAAEGSSGRL